MSEHDIVLEEATQEPVALEVSEVMVEAVSPHVSTAPIAGGTCVTITDIDGSHDFDVMDGEKGDPGEPGDPGQDGVSPTISVTEITGGHRVTVTDADGQHTFDVMNGEPGKPGNPGDPGQDGVSPTITVTDITGGHRVTITDATGAHSFDVMDGEDGQGAVQDVQVNGTSVVTDGVANVPVASAIGDTGLVKVANYQGLKFANDGSLALDAPPPDYHIKGGVAGKACVVAINQHIAAFYGLAKAAGSDEKNSTLPVGQYTESAKSAISQMLNSPVTVTGSTPTIAAIPGIRYVCGEVSTLDIVTPETGCIDVVFTSGSTPTALTVTSAKANTTIKWANSFDPSALEADTVYEINVLDGELGVAGAWT